MIAGNMNITGIMKVTQGTRLIGPIAKPKMGIDL